VCTEGSGFDSIEQSVSIRLALKQQKYFSPLDFLSGIWPKLLAKDPSVIHARGPKITYFTKTIPLQRLVRKSAY
jgi:hypothetical protein